jgi:hypothetical protein
LRARACVRALMRWPPRDGAGEHHPHAAAP